MFGVHQTFCCDATPSRSLKPHSAALLVNTTPNSWFWLLPSGNGFVLVVSRQGLGAQLGGCGLAGGGWGCRSPGPCGNTRGGGGGTFSARCMELFCQCHSLLPLLPSGWLVSWWKSCQRSETSTTVTHVVTHWENPEEMKHYRTVCLYVTYRHNFFIFISSVLLHVTYESIRMLLCCLGTVFLSWPLPLLVSLNFIEEVADIWTTSCRNASFLD